MDIACPVQKTSKNMFKHFGLKKKVGSESLFSRNLTKCGPWDIKKWSKLITSIYDPFMDITCPVLETSKIINKHFGHQKKVGSESYFSRNLTFS